MTTPDPAKPRETPLRGAHDRLGASMTEFAGWLMPLRYRSETAEHQAVRSAAGLFDLSHMGEISVHGPGAAAALDYALAGELSAVPPGRARYTMICAADGGILDDLIVYRLAAEEFLVVANAANTGVVLAALTERAAGHDAEVTDQTDGYALIAIQGPAAASCWPGPGTPAKMVSSCSPPCRTRSTSGPRWRRRGPEQAWCLPGWPHGTPSGWRRACRCMATSLARTSRRSTPAWAGW